MGSCFSEPRNPESRQNEDIPFGALPDEVNRLLDRWPVGHVMMIRKRFFEAKPNKLGEIDLVGFRSMFTELDQSLGECVVSGAFRQFDTRKVGSLTFRDVCFGLATTCLSSWDVRSKFLFSWFDVNSSSGAETFLLSVSAAVNRCQQEGDLSVRFPLDADRLSFEATGLSPPREDLERVQSCVTAAQSEVYSAVPGFSSDHRQMYVPSVAERDWIDKECVSLLVSQEAREDRLKFFQTWCFKNSHYLYPLLELFEIVPSPERERRICFNILRSTCPSSTWYVVSYKWIQRWKSYVHWTEKDSACTVWSRGVVGVGSPAWNSPTAHNHQSSEVVMTMSSALSCTSSVLLQRMMERPSAINNSDIEGELKGTLKANLVEHHDFVLVPEELWLHLTEWYGGGPAFPRKALPSCGGGGVELYPSLISVVLCGARHFTKRFFVSRSDTCGDLLAQLSLRLVSKSADLCRLWHRRNGEQWELLTTTDQGRKINDFVDPVTSDAGTFMLETWPFNQHNLDAKGPVQVGDKVDAKTDSGGWRPATVVDFTADEELIRVKVHFDGEQYTSDAWVSCGPDEIAPLFKHSKNEGGISRSCFKFLTTRKVRWRRTETRPSSAGMGLENIGNTCFMNAILQCLSSTPMLRNFFVSDQFSHHHLRGELAGEFASLLSAMCAPSSKKNYLAPRSFKKALEKFAPRFAGYEHQDAHELLAVLLDGLHEDLNRGKPTSVASSSGICSKIMGSTEAWSKHRTENASVISDLFDGQQRIDTTCNLCGHTSTMYEPFRYVMLPVPVTDFRTMLVNLVVSAPQPRIIRLSVQVPKSFLVQQMLNQISVSHKTITEKFNVDWSCSAGGVVLAEVYLSQLHRFADSYTPVSEFRSDDKLYAFQVSKGELLAQVVHRKKVLTRRRQRKTVWQKKNSLFGLPFVISVSPQWTFQQLYVHIQTFAKHHSPSSCPPFIIRFTLPDGSAACSACDRAGCEGCILSPHSQRVISSCLNGNWMYLAIDWVNAAHYNAELELPGESCCVLEEEMRNSSIPVAETVSLYDCLDSYTAPERLGGENQWFCEKCTSKVDADRKVSWSLAPDVLVVLLKRFQFTAAGLEKITVPISFPLKDLQFLKSGDTCYDLYAVVNHFGTLSCGHYTAFCRQEDEQWCLFNDHEVVAPISWDVVADSSKSCYVLFYKRGTTRSANVINYS